LIKYKFIKYCKSIKIELEQNQYYLISKPLVSFKYDNFISLISKIKETSLFRDPDRNCNQFEEVFRTKNHQKREKYLKSVPNIGK
jgi:hypothetical protein